MHMSDIEDQTEVPVDSTYSVDDKGARKLLFKKRSTSSTCAVIRKLSYGLKHEFHPFYYLFLDRVCWRLTLRSCRKRAKVPWGI